MKLSFDNYIHIIHGELLRSIKKISWIAAENFSLEIAKARKEHNELQEQIEDNSDASFWKDYAKSKDMILENLIEKYKNTIIIDRCKDTAQVTTLLHLATFVIAQVLVPKVLPTNFDQMSNQACNTEVLECFITFYRGFHCITPALWRAARFIPIFFLNNILTLNLENIERNPFPPNEDDASIELTLLLQRILDHIKET